MTLLIPLQPVPSQTVNCTLGGQSCQIAVYQKTGGLYVDLFVNNAAIITGVIAESGNVIVRSAYLGFSGDIAIFDTQPPGGVGVDPYSSGLGSRFQLFYFAASELPPGLA